MAKKKPSRTSRTRTRAKDLGTPAGGASKVKGGLLASTRPLLASPQLTEGNTQPPRDLRHK
jgi:hypothetical protein